MASKLVVDAIAQYKTGNKTQARWLLVKAIKQNSQDDDAWYVMAAVVDKNEQRIKFLKRAIDINPQNEKAIRALEKYATVSESSLSNAIPPGISKYFCPYCQVKLEKKPTRKKKCPNCMKYIYVRKGALLTEEDTSIKDWATRLRGFGITENEIARRRNKIREQFGKYPLVIDAVWSILDGLKGIHRYKKIVYYEMARIYRMEGRDPTHPLAEVHKLEIAECRRSMERFRDLPHRVTVFNCNDDHVCESCLEIKKEYFDIDKVPGLPYEKCTNPDGCRCWISWRTYM